MLNILNIQKVSVYSEVYKATKTFYILLFATISVLIGPFFFHIKLKSISTRVFLLSPISAEMSRGGS